MLKKVLLIVLLLLCSLTPLLQAAPAVPLNDAEQAWIKAHPLIRASNEMDWPPFDFNQNGTPQGFSIDLLNLIAERTGLTIEYTYGYSWNELQEMLRHKQLDLLHSLNYSDYRARFMLFTEPYISNQTVIVTAKSTYDIHNIDDLKGKRVAVIDGYNQKQVLTDSGLDIIFVSVDSPLAALKAVSSGQADASIRFNGVSGYLINHHMLTNLKFVNQFESEQSNVHGLNFAVRDDWPMLRDILQKGLATVSGEELDNLKRKWMALEQSDRVEQISLTAREQQWLEENRVVRFSGAAHWAPVSALDPQQQYSGMAIDFLALLAEKSGLTFVGEATETFAGALTKIKQGEIELISAISTDPLRRSLVDFSTAYLHADAVLITTDEVNFIDGPTHLRGQRVGSVRDFVISERLLQDQPNLKLETFATAKAGLKALSQGQLDVFVIDIPTFEYYSKQLSLTNLKISGLTPYTFDIAIGVAKNQPELLSILNKSLALISLQEKNRIYNKWVSFETPLVDYRLIWQISLAALIFLLVLLYWNRRLAREVELRQKAEEEALQAARIKSDFLANMSHEIRTPMNAVIGMTGLALKLELEEKARNYVAKANRAAIGLLGVINDILDLSKIEAGKLELSATHFSLRELLSSVLDLVEESANDKQLHIKIKKQQGIPGDYFADSLRLGQVLINLLNNAVKFSHPQGTVSLAVQLAEETAEEVLLHFSVTDQGIGISPDNQQKLFQSFSQADSSTTREYGGSGLGLAISSKIVKLMGGEISVVSEEGEGSCFSFTVRLKKADPAQLATIAQQSSIDEAAKASLNGLRLLLVEDDDINQEIMSDLLAGEGIGLTIANNGQEALDILANQRFDGILMDCQMPVMDGYEATRQIRRNSALKELPILALTANVMAQDIAKVLAVGMNDHIAKPILPQQLFATLVKWFAKVPQR